LPIFNISPIPQQFGLPFFSVWAYHRHAWRKLAVPTRNPFAPLLGALLVCLAGCAATFDGEERWRIFNDEGVKLFSRREYRQALENFDYALTLHSQDSILIFNIAQCYDRLGDATRAEQYYASCLQHDPKHADAQLALIEIRFRAGKTADANKMIQDWLKEDPTSADPIVADAWRLRREKNMPLAQARLEDALAVDMNNRRALTEMAILWESQGMPDRAYVLYERILERDPKQDAIRDRLEQLKAKGVKRPLPV
jgi:Tfp pilus assembly protein PilF